MLIDWVRSGRTGKYLSLGQDVRTSLRSVRTSWPRAKYFPVRASHSVNKYIVADVKRGKICANESRFSGFGLPYDWIKKVAWVFFKPIVQRSWCKTNCFSTQTTRTWKPLDLYMMGLHLSLFSLSLLSQEKRRMDSHETHMTGDEDIIVTKTIRSVSGEKLFDQWSPT